MTSGCISGDSWFLRVCDFLRPFYYNKDTASYHIGAASEPTLSAMVLCIQTTVKVSDGPVCTGDQAAGTSQNYMHDEVKWVSEQDTVPVANNRTRASQPTGHRAVTCMQLEWARVTVEGHMISFGPMWHNRRPLRTQYTCFGIL